MNVVPPEVNQTVKSSGGDSHFVTKDETGLSERQTKSEQVDETRPVNMSVVWIMRVK